AAGGGIPFRLGDELRLGVLAPAAAAVGAHAVRVAAPKLVERQPGRLAGEIPQRDVERGDRHAGDADAPHAAVAAVHLVPQALDLERILPDQQALEPRVEVGQHGFRAAAAEHHAVALAAHAFVGRDVGDDEFVVRPLGRYRPRRGDGEKAGLDGSNFHGGTYFAADRARLNSGVLQGVGVAGVTSERRNAERRRGIDRRAQALDGRGIAEMLDPDGEEAYWRENYATQSYYESGLTYDDYHPGYRTGWEGRARYEGRSFDEVEPDLRAAYERVRRGSRLGWDRNRD